MLHINQVQVCAAMQTRSTDLDVLKSEALLEFCDIFVPRLQEEELSGSSTGCMCIAWR